MLNAFIVTLREIAELLLIAEAMRTYLAHAGQHHLMRRVRIGMAAGVVLGTLLAGWLVSLAWSPGIKAAATVVFGVGITVLATRMLASARVIHSRVQDTMEAWDERGALPLVVVGFAVFAAARESMEVTLFLHAAWPDADGAQALAGVLLAIAAAAVLAGVYRSIRSRVDLLLLFQLSTLLLSLLAIQLLLGGIGDFLQAQAGGHADQGLASAAAPFLKGGPWYVWLCAGLMVGPVLTLANAWWRDAPPRP